MGKDLKDITKEIKSFFPIYDDMISSKNIDEFNISKYIFIRNIKRKY